jgi:hypothetical protein
MKEASASVTQQTAYNNLLLYREVEEMHSKILAV